MTIFIHDSEVSYSCLLPCHEKLHMKTCKSIKEVLEAQSSTSLVVYAVRSLFTEAGGRKEKINNFWRMFY